MVTVGFLAQWKSAAALEELENEQLITRSSTIASGVENVLMEELKLIKAFSIDSELQRSLSSLDNQLVEFLEYKMNTFKMIDPEDLQTCLIIDAQGICLAGSEEGYAGIDLSDRDYFQHSIKNEVYVGQPERNKKDPGTIYTHFCPCTQPGGGCFGSCC